MKDKKKLEKAFLPLNKRHKSIIRIVGSTVEPTTCFFVARVLNALPHWVSGRFTELLEFGYIEIVGYSLNLQTKRKVRCYQLTKKGLRILSKI